MLHVLVLAAQILAASTDLPPAYASSALREIVDRAAAHNLNVPANLLAYRAHGESELSVLLRGDDGEDVAVSIEQAQNDVTWQRAGAFTQHVIAYRARAAGPSMSALAVLRKPWTIPTLYGNRLSLFFGQDSASGPLRDSDAPIGATAAQGGTLAVHPFSVRRDAVYTFRGGDTVAVLNTGERTITLVRIVVEPRAEQPESPVVAFRGEIHLDAELGEIVRLRGQFVTLERRGPQRQRLLVLPVAVSALVDLESVLIAGRYWLPRYQRIERHVSIRGLAEGNTVFRIVSRFSDHRITERPAAELPLMDPAMLVLGAMGGAEPDAMLARNLTVSSDAYLAEPRSWVLPLGDATASLHGDDFDDLLGHSLSAAPRLAWRVQRPADVVQFNRIAGWTTGAGIEFTPGERAPRLRFRANAGWAWTEQTVRGRVDALYDGADRWTAGARIGRTLDITNDFTASRDSGGSLLAALAGRDDYDYVDRRAAALWLNLQLIPRMALLRFEAGAAHDAGAPARLTRGLWAGGAPLAPNRGVAQGTYARTSLTADWNPAVTATPLTSGLGARVQYEAAAGEIAWQRSSVRILGRRDVRDFGVAALVDGGVVSGRDLPPQQLLEVGGEGSLEGFDYKEFAGDRAVVLHGRVLYRLPMLRAPVSLFGCRCLTAPAPAIVATLHGAWLWAAPGTMTSITNLGTHAHDGTPLSRLTEGWRGSAELGVRLFGGALTIGAARVLQSGEAWRPSVSIGQQW